MKIAEKRRIKRALLDAIYCFDNTKAGFARAIGVSDSLVQHWINFRIPVSLKKACAIEKATRGAVKAKDLVEWMPGKLK